MNYKRDNFASLYADMRMAVDCLYITTYAKLRPYLEQYNQGLIRKFILIGPPGCGKTENLVQRDRQPDSYYFSGKITPCRFYSWLYQRRNEKSIVLDDVDSLFRSEDGLELIRKLGSPRPVTMTWNTTNGEHQRDGVPTSFRTEASFAVVANKAVRYSDEIASALFDRCNAVVIFDPSNHEILEYAKSWWWRSYPNDGDVIAFVEDNLDKCRRLRLRTLTEKIMWEKSVGNDWRARLLDYWSQDPDDPESERLELMRMVQSDIALSTIERRDEYCRIRGCSKKTYYNDLKLFKKVYPDFQPPEDRWSIGTRIDGKTDYQVYLDEGMEGEGLGEFASLSSSASEASEAKNEPPPPDDGF